MFEETLLFYIQLNWILSTGAFCLNAVNAKFLYWSARLKDRKANSDDKWHGSNFFRALGLLNYEIQW